MHGVSLLILRHHIISNVDIGYFDHLCLGWQNLK